MASIMQQLRRMTVSTGVSPSESGRKEGELFIDFGTIDSEGKAKLWAFGGKTGSGAPSGRGWIQLNSDPTINVVSKKITGTADPATDGNKEPDAPGAWPWVVKAGEVPIVTHNGTAYAFTGGTGSWGSAATGGKALQPSMFTPLGATPGKPEFHDWSSNTAANLGAAYTAASPTFGTGLIVVKWKDGQTYVLTDPAHPDVTVSYEAVASSSPDQKITVLNWTGTDYDPPATTKIEAAYGVWSKKATTNRLDSKDVTLVNYGSPKDTYIVTKPNDPTANGSYLLLHHPAEALAFTATYDITAAFDPSTMTPAHTGDFGLVDRDGTLWKTGVTATEWPIKDAVPGASTFKQGDMLIWDGSEFVALANEIDLSAYLKLAGGTMTDSAAVLFDVPATAGLATRIDGKDPTRSALDNFTIDAGTWT
jgi:hypothetical protein